MNEQWVKEVCGGGVGEGEGGREGVGRMKC
jgi:hypothetical protein